ncbi:hypothetical protein Cgig2_034091 [Carnegiea gigantea]|uniref:Uncharacterized protein n=1 Tax=Carnegiea gigantea TaxID=171969 RepID=A0A9Q1GZF6_9CARY|nr:hypothetical protein Cgig2_034091 [Carnegiea gigantea]
MAGVPGECSCPASVEKLKPTKSKGLTLIQEMDSSWIKLANDHPNYLDGAVKFIKLPKENLVEGRTRCPCRRCKVEYIDMSTPEGGLRKALAVAAQSLGHPSSSTATAQLAQPASSLKASESLVRQHPLVLCPTSSGVLRLPTQPLQPPTAVARASAEASGCSGQILPPPSTGTGASKLIAQQRPVGLSRSTGASKPLAQ